MKKGEKKKVGRPSELTESLLKAKEYLIGDYETFGDYTLGIVCKTGPNSYKKHLLGLSNNTTYFVEQIDGKDVSVYHHKVIFKPSILIPDLEIK